MRGNAWVARALLVGGVLLATQTHSLLAQKISLTPSIGVYVPTTELVKAASGEEFKQEMSFTVGGRLGVMLSKRLGFEFTGGREHLYRQRADQLSRDPLQQPALVSGHRRRRRDQPEWRVLR
jgi:hypothetical protein